MTKLSPAARRAREIVCAKKNRFFVRVGRLDSVFTINVPSIEEAEALLSLPLKDDEWLCRLIFDSCPELQKIAFELVEEGSLEKHHDIVSVISKCDQAKIVSHIQSYWGVGTPSEIDILEE